ncbi:MAG: MFS transporter [SAR324 cluster bacterium]|nr:MFS transporter [SAR324 cluster bacterium]
MAQQSSSPLIEAIGRRVYYGWVMVGMGFVGMFASGVGQSFTVSVFVNPIIDDLGISRTSISSAYTLGTLTAAFGLTYLGRLIDRIGQRAMLVAVAFLLGVSAMLFSTVGNLVALYAAFTAVRIFGQGAMMLTSTNLVSQWFVRRRGFALSLTNLGFAVASAIIPPAVQLLSNQQGWRIAWIWLGLATWVLVIPSALLLVRNRPEALGLMPDGAGGATAQADVPPDEDGSWTVREALRTRQFWIMAVSIAIPSMLITGMVFHQISYLRGMGLSAQAAANVFTVTAVSMVAFGLVFGYLLDRYQTQRVVALGMLCMAASMYTMLAADTPLLAALYGVVFGTAIGAMMMMGSYVWPRYFGRQHLGGVQGVAATITITGASLGPLPFGLAFDLLGGYGEAVLLLSLLPLLAAIAVWLTPPPLKPALRP